MPSSAGGDSFYGKDKKQDLLSFSLKRGVRVMNLQNLPPFLNQMDDSSFLFVREKISNGDSFAIPMPTGLIRLD